jgi:hypothetical protein
MAIPDFKRGSTLSASGTYTPGTGAPATLAGATVTSKILDYDRTHFTFTVEVDPNNLDYTLTLLDTNKFSLGVASLDLRIVWSATQIQYTTTRQINVVEQITTEDA